MENDRLYRDPALVRFYDLDNGWSDNSQYCLDMAMPGQSVLDLGCGTGLVATRLAERCRVTGVDPADAMLDVARRREGGDRVDWVLADARTVRLPRKFDLVVLTGHAFQVFLSDGDQLAICQTIAAHLAPGGRFVFDSRNPVCQEWLEWTPAKSRWEIIDPELGPIEAWNDVHHDEATGIARYGTFYRAKISGQVWSAHSSIRFTPRDVIARRLREAGLGADKWLGDWKGAAYQGDSKEIIPIGMVR